MLTDPQCGGVVPTQSLPIGGDKVDTDSLQNVLWDHERGEPHHGYGVHFVISYSMDLCHKPTTDSQTHAGGVQVSSVHMHFNVKGLQNNHASLKLHSNFFATLHPRKLDIGRFTYFTSTMHKPLTRERDGSNQQLA